MKGLWLLLLARGAAEAQEPRFFFYVLDMRHLPVLREVRDRYVDRAAPPAVVAVREAPGR
jgi:hypothetical protein